MKKTWFLKIVLKTELSVFASELFIYTFWSTVIDTPGFSFFLSSFSLISLLFICLFMCLFFWLRLRRQQNPGLFGKMRTSASSRFVPENAEEAPPSDPRWRWGRRTAAPDPLNCSHQTWECTKDSKIAPEHFTFPFISSLSWIQKRTDTSQPSADR